MGQAHQFLLKENNKKTEGKIEIIISLFSYKTTGELFNRTVFFYNFKASKAVNRRFLTTYMNVFDRRMMRF